jgi:hypothetical protein
MREGSAAFAQHRGEEVQYARKREGKKAQQTRNKKGKKRNTRAD